MNFFLIFFFNILYTIDLVSIVFKIWSIHQLRLEKKCVFTVEKIKAQQYIIQSLSIIISFIW